MKKILFTIIILGACLVGSSQNWDSVRVGNLDVDSIMLGGAKIWEKTEVFTCCGSSGYCRAFTLSYKANFQSCNSIFFTSLDSCQLAIFYRRNGLCGGTSSWSTKTFYFDLNVKSNITIGTIKYNYSGSCTPFYESQIEWFIADYSSQVNSSKICKFENGIVTEIHYY